MTLSHIESDGSPVYMCRLTICGVTRVGIGDKSNETSPYGTPAQRAFRAAFKDAAEQFGIAAYLDDQTGNKTKEAFARYMHSKGNSKPANEYLRQNPAPTPQKKHPMEPPATPVKPVAVKKPAPAPAPSGPQSDDQATRNRDRISLFKKVTGHNRGALEQLVKQVKPTAAGVADLSEVECGALILVMLVDMAKNNGIPEQDAIALTQGVAETLSGSGATDVDLRDLFLERLNHAVRVRSRSAAPSVA